MGLFILQDDDTFVPACDTCGEAGPSCPCDDPDTWDFGPECKHCGEESDLCDCSDYCEECGKLIGCECECND
jgi:hypothetical protein